MSAGKCEPVDRCAIDWSNIVLPECVVTVPPDSSKADALGMLVGSLADAGRLPRESVTTAVETLLERERIGTTGLGRGLALPHMRSRQVSDFMGAIGVAPAGIDFHSLDGQPTRMIILIISPFDERTRHCEIMGRLATLLSDQTLQYTVQIPRTPTALFRFLGF